LIDIQTNERNGPVVAVSKVTDDDEVMLTTNGGMVIRTKVSTMRTIGRNTLGVRLIKLDDGDTVSSLAKLPEDELSDGVELELPPPDGQPGELNGEAGDGPADEPHFPFEDPHRPHIIDDGVGEAEASDHIDLEDETDGPLGRDDEPAV
jgi:DNA gyrase subunit A